MDFVIQFFLAIWEVDPGLAILAVLSVISFISFTVLVITKVVRGAIAATRQIDTWMQESGRLTRAEAANPELGQEAPALVNLLLTHGKMSRNAVRATVLDLAARGAVSLHQPDNDPGRTVLLAVRESTIPLTPYESRVLTELRRAGTGVRLASMPMLQATGLRRWHRLFRREVQAEARERGLTYLDTSILTKTIASTFVPFSVCGFFAGLGPIVVVIYIVATIVVGERSRVWLTRDGRAVLSRWLGVRGWLHAHEVFADLPPAAVAVWGRYLAYGAAMDVLRPAAATRPS
jgi:hypothetical protein